MKTIITPTDFSAVSLNAVNYAADLAIAVNANLLVLHATETPFGLNKNASMPDKEDCEEKLIVLRKNLIKRTENKIKSIRNKFQAL